MSSHTYDVTLQPTGSPSDYPVSLDPDESVSAISNSTDELLSLSTAIQYNETESSSSSQVLSHLNRNHLCLICIVLQLLL